MMNEKMIYEQPMLQIVLFDVPVMSISDGNLGQWDQDGDGWTDGWV